MTPAVKREAVAHLKALLGLSERRACRIACADRKMVRYQAQRAPDTVLRGRLRELANERRRFGYRRLFVLLRREGEPSGINRIYRLYREEGLTAAALLARNCDQDLMPGLGNINRNQDRRGLCNNGIGHSRSPLRCGLLQNHCRDLRPGYDHLLRNLGGCAGGHSLLISVIPKVLRHRTDQ